MSISEFETMSETEMRGIMAGSGPLVSTPGIISPNPFINGNWQNLYQFIQPNGAGEYIPPGFTLPTVTVVSFKKNVSLFDSFGISLGVPGSTFEMSNKVAELLKISTTELEMLGKRIGYAALGVQIAEASYHYYNGQYSWEDTLGLGLAVVGILNPYVGLAGLAYDIFDYYKKTH